MKLSIVISTYMRKDGTTPIFLKRALDSVFSQTHEDFKLFLIGDKYENEKEVLSIINTYPKEKIYFENLSEAKERDFHQEKWAIWSYGGVNATNYGIEISLKENYDYICHLDHDDYWTDNHLSEISRCINETGSDWMCTKSQYIMGLVYPKVKCNSNFCVYSPVSEGLIHSSVCMNFKKIPLRYRDLYKETGKCGQPADSDLWVRVADYCKNNNLKTTLINKLTCYHLEEGYERI